MLRNLNIFEAQLPYDFANEPQTLLDVKRKALDTCKKSLEQRIGWVRPYDPRFIAADNEAHVALGGVLLHGAIETRAVDKKELDAAIKKEIAELRLKDSEFIPTRKKMKSMRDFWRESLLKKAKPKQQEFKVLIFVQKEYVAFDTANASQISAISELLYQTFGVTTRHRLVETVDLLTQLAEPPVNWSRGNEVKLENADSAVSFSQLDTYNNEVRTVIGNNKLPTSVEFIYSEDSPLSFKLDANGYISGLKAEGDFRDSLDYLKKSDMVGEVYYSELLSLWMLHLNPFVDSYTSVAATA